MKIKVCGMKYEENINAISLLEPDYIGFIFYEFSKRKIISPIKCDTKNIKRVGVFVNSDEKTIFNMVKINSLNLVQLHGEESPKLCENLKKRSLKIIKAFAIDDNFDFSKLNIFKDCVDYFLFDTKGLKYGGNGYSFNWNLIENYKLEKPYFLSGGISLESLDKIKEFKKNKASKYCYGIDINSQFEVKPGYKDKNKVKIFIDKL